VLATLPVTDYSNLNLLANADVAQAAFNIQQSLDLIFVGFTNARGANEKYFTSQNGHNAANSHAYTLLPDGELHQFDNSLNAASGPLVAMLNPSYWNNATTTGAPLTSDPAPPPAPAGVSAVASGASPGGVTVNVSGDTPFVGTFGVSTTVQDGLLSVPQDFLFMATDTRLSLPSPGPQTASVGGGSPQLKVTLTGSDPDVNPTPSSALTYQAVNGVFLDQLSAQAAAVMQLLNLKFIGGLNTYGQDEIYFQSQNGNNPNNFSYYLMTPDGALPAWNGTTDSRILNAPVLATFDPTYYATPSKLTSPMKATSATASVSGNQVTYNGFVTGDETKTFWGAALVFEPGVPGSANFTTYSINVGP
jgi:hypothetical protein